MPTVLTEGQVGATSQGSILYPEINTCMSMTLVYGDPEYLVGAHFSCPVEGMDCVPPATIIQKMRSMRALIGTLKQIFLIGSRNNWSLTMMRPLYEFAGELDDTFSLQTEYSTSDWKSVNVDFKPGGAIEIRPTASGKTGSNSAGAPTSWRV